MQSEPMKASIPSAVISFFKTLTALCVIRPATAFAAIVGLGLAVGASGQIIQVNAIGTVGYLTGSNVNPSVGLGTTIHFSAILDQSTPSISHYSGNGGVSDIYKLVEASFSYGDVQVDHLALETSLHIIAGVDDLWAYQFIAFDDANGTGCLLTFDFQPGAFGDSGLPLREDFVYLPHAEALVAVQTDYLDASPYEYLAQTSSHLDTFWIERLDNGGAVPEPSTYGLFGVATLLGLIALKRRCKGSHK